MKYKNEQKPLCGQPAPIMQPFDPTISQNRLSFILRSNKKWTNGTEIKYMFVEGAEEQKEVVRAAFAHWKSLGIGISFKEVIDVNESMVRIGFNPGLGSWSNVGRDILTVPKPGTTMNFGWDLTNDYGLTTALHEIGHTIGFEHEHQSPFSGIVWDTEAVYAEFKRTQGWSTSKIDDNVINKISSNQVQGSQWDSNSIMEYQFNAGLIKEPAEFRNGVFPPGTLSDLDISGVKSFYPEIDHSAVQKLQLMQTTIIKANKGQQADFLFTAPLTKKYTFQTVGEMDTVMVVSEKGKKENYYLSGDDDSGFNKNTRIQLPLVKGRDYLVNVRVLFAADGNSGGILVF